MVHLDKNRREICTKSKRKRLVDEEITTNVFVWNSNEFKQADENDNHLLSELDKPDPCMRPQEEITLHEPDNINEDDRREHNVRRILLYVGINTEHSQKEDSKSGSLLDYLYQ